MARTQTSAGVLSANEAKRETASERQQPDQTDKRKRTCGGGQRVVGGGRGRRLATSRAYGVWIRGCAAGEAGSLIIARIRGDCRHLLAVRQRHRFGVCVVGPGSRGSIARIENVCAA